jgi:hypothetical protein
MTSRHRPLFQTPGMTRRATAAGRPSRMGAGIVRTGMQQRPTVKQRAAQLATGVKVANTQGTTKPSANAAANSSVGPKMGSKAAIKSNNPAFRPKAVALSASGTAALILRQAGAGYGTYALTPMKSLRTDADARTAIGRLRLRVANAPPARNLSEAWTATRKRTSEFNLLRHYRDHAREFGHQSFKQYRNAAHSFHREAKASFERDGNKNFEYRQLAKRQDGSYDEAYMDKRSKVVLIVDARGVPRTLHTASPKSDRFPRGYGPEFSSPEDYFLNKLK